MQRLSAQLISFEIDFFTVYEYEYMNIAPPPQLSIFRSPCLYEYYIFEYVYDVQSCGRSSPFLYILAKTFRQTRMCIFHIRYLPNCHHIRALPLVAWLAR